MKMIKWCSNNVSILLYDEFLSERRATLIDRDSPAPELTHHLISTSSPTLAKQLAHIKEHKNWVKHPYKDHSDDGRRRNDSPNGHQRHRLILTLASIEHVKALACGHMIHVFAVPTVRTRLVQTNISLVLTIESIVVLLTRAAERIRCRVT